MWCTADLASVTGEGSAERVAEQSVPDEQESSEAKPYFFMDVEYDCKARNKNKKRRWRLHSFIYVILPAEASTS